MKAVVVVNGEPAASDVGQLADAELVIAADGGAAWLLEQVGRLPDRVIGDLDSLDEPLLRRLQTANVPIERHPREKEASDAELALQHAVAAGAEEVVILGAIGGQRLDHALAGLLLLADARHAGRALRLVHGETQIRPLGDGQRLELRGKVGDLVSLLPVGGDARGVATEGLRYPLRGETLPLGTSRGLSNEISASPAAVSLERGTLLVIEIAKGVQS